MLPKTIKMHGLEFSRRYKSCSYDLKLYMELNEFYALNVDGILVGSIDIYYSKMDKKIRIFIDVWNELYKQHNRKYVLNFNRWIMELMMFEKGLGILPFPDKIKDSIVNDKHYLYYNSLTTSIYILSYSEHKMNDYLMRVSEDYNEHYKSIDRIPCFK